MEKTFGDEVTIEELSHLNEIQKIISGQLAETEESMERSREDILQQKRHLWENIYELDPQEIASDRVHISEEHDSWERKEVKRRLLLKQQDNPYFGRIDFVYEGEEEPEILYIGLGGLRDKKDVGNLIYDWRAPICGMYYDFDTGKAYYDAPEGRFDGEIVKKRQLKIKKGVLEYALESNFNVDDEILQRELSGSSSTKMRNIVATIQKEQNLIVRDQVSNVMVVQGVAGSGKTSIALHRIAFLLYQNRKNLKSSEVLIISPNTVFSDYISNVLPELGEQNITEVSFDEIAAHEMRGIAACETKYEQMEYVIDCEDEKDARLQSIRFKSGPVFLDELKAYVKELEKTLFHFSDYSFHGDVTDAKRIEDLYYGMMSAYPAFVRMNNIAERIADIYESNHNAVLSAETRNEMKQNLRGMAATTDLSELYGNFIDRLKGKYVECKEWDLLSSRILYEDVFPVILLKFLLFGNEKSNFRRMKHVIVDEMQDYSMVQFEMLRTLFKCNMTILGDVNQVVDKNKASLADHLQNIFGEKVTFVKMTKSYRSTCEISEF